MRPANRRLSRVLAASGLLFVGLAPLVHVPAASATETYPAPVLGSWTLYGRGNGHGHGLSQYGARGAAIAGLSYQQILAFYYPGTSLGIVPSSTQQISVRLDSAGEPTTVLAQAGLQIGSIALGTAGVDQWRLLPGGGGFVLQSHSSSGWTSRGIVPSPAAFSTSAGTVTVVSAGGTTTYRGTVAGVRTSLTTTGAITVNKLTVDDYLKGVVPSEMPASWPTAALQSQTIAARSYAWYHLDHPLTSVYDICADTRCQQYGGVDAEQPQSNQVVTQTSRLVVAYQGKVAFAEFSASNGGITSDDGGAHPYFVTKADPYDAPASGDPYLTTWTRAVSAATVAAAYGWTSVTSIQITSRAPSGYTGLWGGLPDAVTVSGILNGTPVSRQVSGASLAATMGLPYRYFTIRPVVPIGHLDSVTKTALHTVHVRGWTIDPTDTASSNSVAITVNSNVTTGTAALPRPDVQAAYQTVSANHGFDIAVPVPGGTSRICAYGVMLTTPDRALLGCATVTVPVNPMGRIEAATPLGGGRVQLTGWELDPDLNGGPGTVQVYVDYRTWFLVSSSLSRPDVQSYFGLANAATGFRATITMAPGVHTVCAYGLNASGTPGSSVQLGCARVTAS